MCSVIQQPIYIHDRDSSPIRQHKLMLIFVQQFLKEIYITKTSLNVRLPNRFLFNCQTFAKVSSIE